MRYCGNQERTRAGVVVIVLCSASYVSLGVEFAGIFSRKITSHEMVSASEPIATLDFLCWCKGIEGLVLNNDAEVTLQTSR